MIISRFNATNVSIYAWRWSGGYCLILDHDVGKPCKQFKEKMMVFGFVVMQERGK